MSEDYGEPWEIDEEGWCAPADWWENQPRIVACVNACAGIPTAELERLKIASMVTEANNLALRAEAYICATHALSMATEAYESLFDAETECLVDAASESQQEAQRSLESAAYEYRKRSVATESLVLVSETE